MPGNREKVKTIAKFGAAEKRARALRLRIGGATYEQIAAEVGFTARGAAYRAVSQALRDIPREHADQLRQIEMDRFDAIQIRLMQKLNQGDLSVVPNLLRLAEQRARLLGLNMPVQVDLQVAGEHTDPATVKLMPAIQAAKERRDRLIAEVVDEAEEYAQVIEAEPVDDEDEE